MELEAVVSFLFAVVDPLLTFSMAKKVKTSF